MLALQGAFAEHMAVLDHLGAEARAIRLPGELEGVEGVVLPGGESTAIGKLMVSYGLVKPLRDVLRTGRPALATCAGMILLAKGITGFDQQDRLGVMDIQVTRNAFGRQVDSFETDLSIDILGPEPFRAVFIRAPYIEKAGDGVKILARLPDGRAVAARQGNLLATAFHPELSGDVRLHAFFLSLVKAQKGTHARQR